MVILDVAPFPASTVENPATMTATTTRNGALAFLALPTILPFLPFPPFLPLLPY
jgi:hypothetical protein